MATVAHLLRRAVVHDAGADRCDLVPVLEENVDAREASSKDRAQPGLFFLLETPNFDFEITHDVYASRRLDRRRRPASAGDAAAKL